MLPSPLCANPSQSCHAGSHNVTCQPNLDSSRF